MAEVENAKQGELLTSWPIAKREWLMVWVPPDPLEKYHSRDLKPSQHSCQRFQRFPVMTPDPTFSLWALRKRLSAWLGVGVASHDHRLEDCNLPRSQHPSNWSTTPVPSLSEHIWRDTSKPSICHSRQRTNMAVNAGVTSACGKLARHPGMQLESSGNSKEEGTSTRKCL